MTGRAKPTIAIDIDDVLANSTESLRLQANELAGANLQPEHYKIEGEYWGYYEHVWRLHGLIDRVSYSDVVRGMDNDQSHIPLMPGADTAINELSKRFNLMLITSRESSWEVATKRWLEAHFFDRFSEIYFTTNHKDDKAKNKGQLCREIGAGWLIDDNVEHCKSAVDEGIQAILFGDYGWQKSIPTTVVRCKDWPSIVEFFDEG